jgi:hypothetical protein
MVLASVYNGNHRDDDDDDDDDGHYSDGLSVISG